MGWFAPGEVVSIQVGVVPGKSFTATSAAPTGKAVIVEGAGSVEFWVVDIALVVLSVGFDVLKP